MYRAGSDEEQTAKVFAAKFEAGTHEGVACGTVESDSRSFIRVACRRVGVSRRVADCREKRLAVRELLPGWRDVLQYRFEK